MSTEDRSALKAKSSKIEALIVAYGNATFACGEYPDDDEYGELLKEVHAAKAALLDAIEAEMKLKRIFYYDVDCKHRVCVPWKSGGISRRKCLDCGAII